MKKFLFIFSILVLILALSSCMLVRGSSKPMIFNFTKSATLLSGQNINFSANVVDSNGLSGVVFELDGAPIPTTLIGTSLYTANWLGVYGYHKVTLFAAGSGGNVATKTDSFFVKDSTPPIVKAFYPDTISRNVNFPVRIDVYDPESGIQAVSLSVDGKNTPFNSNTFNLSFATLGIHDFTVTALNGQGLISTPTFYINVVKSSDAKPYIQFTNMPELISAGHQSTITVYAYSPNGIQSVGLKIGKLSKELSANASNTYTFNFKIPTSETEGLYEATCTVVDDIGHFEYVTRDVLIAPSGATSVVLIPTINATSTGMIKIPFFAASNSAQFNVSAYVNGVPVQVYGSSPNFYATWLSSYGDDVFTVSINNSIVSKANFTVHPQPLKVESVTYTSTNVTILFSGNVYFYANPIFEMTNGTSSVILNKNDVSIYGNRVYISKLFDLSGWHVNVLGLKDQNGPLNLSFDLP